MTAKDLKAMLDLPPDHLEVLVDGEHGLEAIDTVMTTGKSVLLFKANRSDTHEDWVRYEQNYHNRV